MEIQGASLREIWRNTQHRWAEQIKHFRHIVPKLCCGAWGWYCGQSKTERVQSCEQAAQFMEYILILRSHMVSQFYQLRKWCCLYCFWISVLGTLFAPICKVFTCPLSFLPFLWAKFKAGFSILIVAPLTFPLPFAAADNVFWRHLSHPTVWGLSVPSNLYLIMVHSPPSLGYKYLSRAPKITTYLLSWKHLAKGWGKPHGGVSCNNPLRSCFHWLSSISMSSFPPPHIYLTQAFQSANFLGYNIKKSGSIEAIVMIHFYYDL